MALSVNWRYYELTKLCLGKLQGRPRFSDGYSVAQLDYASFYASQLQDNALLLIAFSAITIIMNLKKIAFIRPIGYARSILFSFFILAANSAPLAAFEASGLRCVIPPSSVTPGNASTIKGLRCSMKVGDAHLMGVLGSLFTYQVMDMKFQVFRPRFGYDCKPRLPCKERVSVNGQALEWAVVESPVNLGFDCGNFYCNWEVWRTLNGDFIFATPWSL